MDDIHRTNRPHEDIMSHWQSFSDQMCEQIQPTVNITMQYLPQSPVLDLLIMIDQS